MLTEERKNELLRQKENKLAELDTLKNKSESDLWREDLDVFVTELDKIEKKEAADANTEMKEKMSATVSLMFQLLNFYFSRKYVNLIYLYFLICCKGDE